MAILHDLQQVIALTQCRLLQPIGHSSKLERAQALQCLIVMQGACSCLIG